MTNAAESSHRREMVQAARDITARGMTHGTTGNISRRTGSRILVTPTGSSMAHVTAEQLSLTDETGAPVTEIAPSKEARFHAAMYRARPDVQAIVHTHSLHATAVSCLADIDMADALPALTAYYAMRVERLPVVPFFPPGDADLAQAVGTAAIDSPTLLLRNHGLLVGAASLSKAIEIAEEIEQTARTYLLLSGIAVEAIPAAARRSLWASTTSRTKG